MEDRTVSMVIITRGQVTPHLTAWRHIIKTETESGKRETEVIITKKKSQGKGHQKGKLNRIAEEGGKQRDSS